MYLSKKLVVGAGVVLLSHVAFLAVFGTRRPGPFLSDLTQVAANMLAAVTCLYCYRRSEQLARQFWLPISFHFLIWNVAQISLIIYVYVLHSSLLPASAPDLLFFVAGAPAAIALFAESGSRSKLKDLQRYIDFLQVFLVIAVGYFYFIYAPSISSDPVVVRRKIENGFILRNIILTSAFWLRAFFASTRNERKLFSIGGIYFVVYSALTAYADFPAWAGEFSSGSWIDLSWTVPAVVMTALAATWQEPSQQQLLVSTRARYREFFFFVGPSIPTLLIVLMAIHISKDHMFLATSALLISFLALAVRLGGTRYSLRLGEEALRGSLSLLEATLESTADGILVVDRSGKIVSFNQRFAELWRIPESLICVKDDTKILAFAADQLKDPQAFLSRVKELYSLPDEQGYDMLEFKDDRVYERYSKPQYVNDVAVGRVWSFRDITQRWSLESQLRHSQKMEAVGTLAGGVAHDFNNLLTIMNGYLQLALNNTRIEPAVASDLREAQRAVEHASSLTKQLLALSRRQVLQPQVLDVNQRISSLLQILRRVIPEDIELTTALEPGLGPVLIDQTQVEQIIMNLAVNARDAMPGGGKLSFHTRNMVIGSDYGVSHPQSRPGEYSVLEISDTGHGMDSAVLGHIFEPFFTTKEPGKGTGLGLSTVYGIVQQSGGFIEVSSQVGKGTTLSVFFPKAGGIVAVPDLEQLPIESPRGNETILVVEDNNELRHLTGKILAMSGYTVLEADAGIEAESICRDYPGNIDLVLSDVVMPGLRGPEVVKRLLFHRPKMRAIYISGFADDQSLNEAVLTEKTDFLQKPFTAPELLAKIREVLDAPTKEQIRVPIA